jgi:mannose-6-phosphate isomerase-like protein (cupin superfamily)
MKAAHLFHAGTTEWQPHPKLRGIRIKSLENSGTFEKASVTLVQIDPGGVIEPHSHESNFETAYVISGNGVLTLPDGDLPLGPGDGVTVPPQTIHSLRNTGHQPIEILAVHIPPMM